MPDHQSERAIGRIDFLIIVKTLKTNLIKYKGRLFSIYETYHLIMYRKALEIDDFEYKVNSSLSS